MIHKLIKLLIKGTLHEKKTSFTKYLLNNTEFPKNIV